MKSKLETYENKLNATTVDACSGKVRAFLAELKLERKEIARYALSIEEILLKTIDADKIDPSIERNVVLTTCNKRFRTFIELSIDGSSNNVFIDGAEEHSALGDSFLKNMGLSPSYDCSGGLNKYTFKIRKKKVNPFILLLIALFSALVIGLLGNTFLSEGVRAACVDNALIPIHDTFLGILGCMAGPMIFLSVAWGIYGIGDASTLKQIGSKLMKSYISVVYISLIAATAICIPVFKPVFESSADSGSAVGEIFSILLAIFPTNIFSPFIDGNTLQIIFLGIILGIALLFLGRRTSDIARIIEQINILVQFLIEVISSLVPYFIFVVLLEMMWSDSLGELKKIGKLFATFIIIALLLMAIMVIYTSLRNRISPSLLLKKGLPTLLTGITTASSAACFGINMKECRESLGIDDKITSFGLPLGVVTFKPATAINYLTMAIFFATIYDVGVSASWLLIAIFTCGILAISTPPIPGGAASAYAVLFVQLGIPAEAIAIALACDAVFDFIATGSDQFLLPYELLNLSGRLGLVDRKTLEEEK